jgi:hypothetical protein
MKIRDILREFASGGSGSNGPFDYGAAIVKIGEDFLDHFTDPQAGEDAAQITKAGETFIEKGMLAGVKFLYQELDTQVRDHVFDELADQGFNVEQDLIALKKRMPRDPEAGRMFAKAQADWRAQPGDTYVVTGQWGKGSSTSQDIKASSAEEAEQKFLASNKGVKFNSIDVKRRGGAAGVSEGHADQQRKIVKRNGRPVGEIGIDRESSPGVGQYYMKHYASGTDNSGYDSREEALGDLRHVMKQSVYGELRERDGRDDEEEDVDDDGRTMSDRARRDGRGDDDRAQR